MKKYQIYDGENSSLFSDYPEIEAKTGKDAIMQLLKSTKRGHYKIKKSGGNDVLFKAEPFYEENGRKYRDGRVIWYARNWE